MKMTFEEKKDFNNQLSDLVDQRLRQNEFFRDLEKKFGRPEALLLCMKNGASVATTIIELVEADLMPMPEVEDVGAFIVNRIEDLIAYDLIIEDTEERLRKRFKM